MTHVVLIGVVIGVVCCVKLISLNMRNEAPALLVSSSGSADGHSLLKPVERKPPWTSSDVQINHDKSRHIQSKSSIAKAGAEPLQELINSIWHSWIEQRESPGIKSNMRKRCQKV